MGAKKHMKTNLKLLLSDNLMQNVYRVLHGKISKEKHKFSHKILQKRVAGSYTQN